MSLLIADTYSDILLIDFCVSDESLPISSATTLNPLPYSPALVASILALSEMRDARMVAQNRGVSMEKVFRG